MTANDILALLERELGIDRRRVNEDTPLFSSGLLDSFAMVTLVTAVEGAAGIKVRATDVTLANFDSVGRILGYVAGRAR
jgi:acyl carrier protein